MKLLTEWVKPSGARLMLNDEDATVEQAEKNGWIRYSETEEGLAAAKEFLAAQVAQAESTVNAAKAKQKGKPGPKPKQPQD
jgi:hypothetical protein